MKSLTIITPTFNRASLLSRCYDSLCGQTDNRFEWIIVDDGSTDNTSEVVSAFIDSEKLSIRYVRKENGGKHTALNASHPFIHGEYVLILDSDDYLVCTAVQEILNAWEMYENDEDVGVLTFLKGSDREHPVCTVKDFNTPVDILRYRRTILQGSDCCEVIRTKLFAQYPFPEFDGEKFIAECALWNRVSFSHKTVYINSVVYICEYLEDGLTKAGRSLRIRCPRGGMFTSDLRMDNKNYLTERFKYGLLYNCYAFFAGVSHTEIIKNCRSPWIAMLCMPGGWMLYLLWRKQFG